jgi:hypothetical protein
MSAIVSVSVINVSMLGTNYLVPNVSLKMAVRNISYHQPTFQEKNIVPVYVTP